MDVGVGHVCYEREIDVDLVSFGFACVTRAGVFGPLVACGDSLGGGDVEGPVELVGDGDLDEADVEGGREEGDECGVWVGWRGRHLVQEVSLHMRSGHWSHGTHSRSCKEQQQKPVVGEYGVLSERR